MHLNAMELLPYTIAFVDGNHENFDKLYEYPIVDFCGGKAHQVRKNIFHLIRGESFIIEGHSFFCFGGAYSRDKATRDPNFWWPQELPNNEEYAHAKKTLAGWVIKSIMYLRTPFPIHLFTGSVLFLTLTMLN